MNFFWMVGMNDHNIKSRLQNINNATNVWVTDSLKRVLFLNLPKIN